MAFRAAAYQKRLEEAGFDPKMAHAQASAMNELVAYDDLDAQLNEIRRETKTEIASLELRLMRWIAGIFGGAATAVIILTVLLVTR